MSSALETARRKLVLAWISEYSWPGAVDDDPAVRNRSFDEHYSVRAAAEREYAHAMYEAQQELSTIGEQISDASALLADTDPDVQLLARGELASLQQRTSAIEEKVRQLNRPWWAPNKLYRLVHGSPSVAWPLIRALVAEAPDDSVLACVAAGPLEDFLTLHGAEFRTVIVDAARSDPGFRRALTGVWGQQHMDRELVRELTRLFQPVAD